MGRLTVPPGSYVIDAGVNISGQFGGTGATCQLDYSSTTDQTGTPFSVSPAETTGLNTQITIQDAQQFPTGPPTFISLICVDAAFLTNAYIRATLVGGIN
jgi:hypothetical protein